MGGQLNVNMGNLFWNFFLANFQAKCSYAFLYYKGKNCLLKDLKTLFPVSFFWWGKEFFQRGAVPLLPLTLCLYDSSSWATASWKLTKFSHPNCITIYTVIGRAVFGRKWPLGSCSQLAPIFKKYFCIP